MPIYSYECAKCGHQFETLVRSSDVPACPVCESTELKRQLSLVASPVKGSDDMPACGCTGSMCGTCPNQFN